MTPDEQRALRSLGRRVDRLRPLNHDPEAFFVERDEIRAELMKLAGDDARTERANPRGKFSDGAIAVDGRIVLVRRRGRRKSLEPKKLFR